MRSEEQDTDGLPGLLREKNFFELNFGLCVAFTQTKCADDLRRRKNYSKISMTKEDNVIIWSFRYYSGLPALFI